MDLNQLVRGNALLLRTGDIVDSESSLGTMELNASDVLAGQLTISRTTSPETIAKATALPVNVDARHATLQQISGIRSVAGDLYLAGTNITMLPENLSVGGDLDLSGTRVTALPENLAVGGDLNLSGTRITTLPESLSVGGDLDLRGYN